MNSPLDDAFNALAKPERRRLLIALADHNRHSAHSFAYPEDVPPAPMGNEKHFRLRMHHNHLPMLETGGFIEWDRDDREIRNGPNFHVIRPLIQVLDEHNRIELANDL